MLCFRRIAFGFLVFPHIANLAMRDAQAKGKSISFQAV
jgi:hypothetical protein